MTRHTPLPLPLLVLVEPTPALRAAIARLALRCEGISTVVAASALERLGPLADTATLVVTEAAALRSPSAKAVAARLARAGRLVLLTDYPPTRHRRDGLEWTPIVDKGHLEQGLRAILDHLRPGPTVTR